MSMYSKKYKDAYYKQVLENQRASDPALAKVFDIIHDLSDRRGLRQEWEEIDEEIQTEIVEKWLEIVSKK